MISKLEPALVTLALEGSKAFSASFDLVHRDEADAPNAIWQADHTELDILVKDTDGTASRPWLTIIIDDYSRAVAGYFLTLSAPSAIQTALALRQAIWRKTQAGWHICGIPRPDARRLFRLYAAGCRHVARPGAERYRTFK